MGNGLSQDEAPQMQPSEKPFNLPNFGTQGEAVEYRPSKPPGTICKPVERKSLPHNFGDIVKDADSPIDRSSMDNLYGQLLAGVFLSQKKRRYWIDNQGKNCFMLYAKDLSITWAEDIRHWHWINIMETRDEIQAAKLLNISWLEVHGKFNTTMLNPRTLYEVLFVILIKDAAYGWGVPVNLRLVLPDGTKQEHKESLASKSKEQWIEIPVGEFRTTPEKIGDMDISMYECEGGHWKRGIIIRGVLIRPKNGT